MKTRERMEDMGKRIFALTRTELYLSMRFLGVALDSLPEKLDLSTRTVGTDGAYLRYNPTYVMQEYLERPEGMGRMYMHMLMHCVFRHMFAAREHDDMELWDLSCDIAAESVLDSMDYPVIWRVMGDFRQEWYEKLQGEIGVLTAEKIYHYFSTRKRDPYLEESLRQEFSACDHSFWQRLQNEDPKNSDSPQELPENQTANSDNDGQELDASPTLTAEQADALDKSWRENAERILDDINSSGSDASKETGRLTWLLTLQNKGRKNFADFLRKISVVREEVTVDMDSFDYGFYMHGLNLYGNMPLIEENEYREADKVEELVIAIDTSASCKGGLVQEFLDETGALLSRQENFFKRVNIYIIECDDRVQREVEIHDLDELKKYSDGFTVSGGYGTDFRPVFDRVQELRDSGRLRDLKGLMYFTDGCGCYPKKATDYETAFVVYGDAEPPEPVPEWIIVTSAQADVIQ
ncbi:MAG: VWA-like domain-containing protein [Clostridiales bacterium]|nr:VWA-like domain-containing protein [Clostridiales bacterium]